MFYIDKNATLSFEEIQTKTFQKTDTNALHLGMTKAAIWVKFSIKNDFKEPLTRYITLTNPLHDTVELYLKQNDGTYKKYTQGMLHVEHYERMSMLHPSFIVSFLPKETKEFYLRAHTLTSANYFQLLLKDHAQLYKDEFHYQLLKALFFGAMMALILYNIFIFIFTKELSYFYYILFITFTTINYLSYSGMLYYIVQNQTLLNIDAFLGIYYISIANLFAILFIDKILHVERFKLLHQINLALVGGSILLMLLSLKIENLFECSMYYLLVCMLYILSLIVFALYKKIVPAKYILVGWSISILGIFSLAFFQYAIPNLIDFFPYFYEFSVVAETILFSVALASKLNKTKELENSLKTNELLTKELHHRIKNNMQFIILMYRLKLANSSDAKMEEKLNEIEGSIQAISQTHEILYKQKNLEILDAKLYFENLLSHIQKSFDTKNIKIILDVTASLDIKVSIFCGIILNELITNALKYAFVNQSGILHVTLKIKNNKHYFCIQDNGIGFDLNQKSIDSFGLDFVENIVKHELKGTFEIQNDKGAKITIRF